MSLCPGRAWSPHHAPPSERAGHVAESRARRVRRGLFFTAVTVTQTVRAGAGPPWVSSGMAGTSGSRPRRHCVSPSHDCVPSRGKKRVLSDSLHLLCFWF